MVLGYHIIISAYGFWLPNDPRGSWSERVRSYELWKAGGRAIHVPTSQSLAGVPHDTAIRLATKRALRYPAVVFSGVQARAVGAGFGEAADRSGLLVAACAVLASHAHLVIGRHQLGAEGVIVALKSAATRRLRREGLHPFARSPHPDGTLPRAFAEGGWKAFLSSEDQIAAAIEYVEQNPVKEGKPAQQWSFVTRTLR